MHKNKAWTIGGPLAGKPKRGLGFSFSNQIQKRFASGMVLSDAVPIFQARQVVDITKCSVQVRSKEVSLPESYSQSTIDVRLTIDLRLETSSQQQPEYDQADFEVTLRLASPSGLVFSTGANESTVSMGNLINGR